MNRRSGWFLISAAIVGVAIVVWLLLSPAAEQTVAASPTAEVQQDGVASRTSKERLSVEAVAEAKQTPPAPAHAAKRRQPISPETQRLRTRVLEALPRQPRESSGAAKDSEASAKAKEGHLVDQLGELNPETMRVMNQELMPLVDECFEAAREGNPGLRGMLGVVIEMAGAEEQGTIIETVEPAEGVNELADEELIECVRQSAFSIQLPLPLKSGRVKRQLTMRFGDWASEAGAAGATKN